MNVNDIKRLGSKQVLHRAEDCDVKITKLEYFSVPGHGIQVLEYWHQLENGQLVHISSRSPYQGESIP